MTYITRLWNKMTQNKALESSSGKLETRFFETIYRVIYVTGLSTVENSVGYFIYSSIVKLFIMLIIIGEIWYMFNITWSVDVATDSINATFIQFSSLFKYRNMIKYRKMFRTLASAMESPSFDISNEARRKIVDIWVKRNRTYLKILLKLGSCTLVAWYGYPFMDDIDYNLMVPVYLPFAYTDPSTYSIVYTTIIVMFTYVSYFVMVYDILIQVYLMQLLCQFAVLQDCFTNILSDCAEDFQGMTETQLLNDERFQYRITKRLRDLINQHRFILNNTLDLREILSGPMLGHLATSTVLICAIGYQIVMSVSVNLTKSLMAFFYLGYNMVVLYILCRWCEELSIQSEAIGFSVYCSGWERGLASIPGVRSTLLLVFTRANKPLVLTAGGMYDLSLASYANLVKTSYSALTMLLRFRQD
ncbi:odorant receptor 13a-like [Papilio machaon]|uniref:odorant receptor 13a-like n=1 Tax=Papilio machaon TaxID=76193 RepID=UPI001E665F3E|nr:odorant receptor 13a-like [Papilio machaon]